ncbi:NADH-quinone oxidoreductase subunit C [Austwickia chelonae]|uniref:NADH-quinone oxidoreductase subunit C n=1 Tax=Austwickia chelonae TaxID=100225 RepID=UPI0013C30980|nr:NADH-quinone oxidoreductase subunit C [Austwickia chelonae]
MNQAEVLTVPVTQWVDTASSAYEDGYTVLEILAAVDESQDDHDPGIDVMIHLVDLHSMSTPRRREIWTRVPPTAQLAGLGGLWPGATWQERVAVEMTGVDIAGCTDRLLLSASYEGPPPLSRTTPLAARGSTPWPGAVEPGESSAGGRRSSRRRLSPPGVPTGWPS